MHFVLTWELGQGIESTCQVDVNHSRHQWQVELPFGGPKQLQALQCTIPSVKIYYPKVRLHGNCQHLRIPTPSK